jgi:putative sigma-54 modulation protein
MQITLNEKSNISHETIRALVETKLKKLDKFFRHIENVHVSHEFVRGQHVVEINLDGDAVFLRSEAREAELATAVDRVVQKLETQIKRFKGRVRTGHQRPGAIKEEIVATIDAAGEDEVFTGNIVRQKKFSPKPMSPEEACGQIELIGHDFFMFVNDISGHVNVLYRRHDGNFGLIEPGI